MEILEKLINQTTNEKDKNLKLKYVNLLYKNIVSDSIKDQLDELIEVLIELLSENIKDIKQNNISNEILEKFYRYLLKEGKKSSVAYDYMKRFERICKEYNITPEDLYYSRSGWSINDLIGTYSKGGNKYQENVDKHHAISSALKQFRSFIDSEEEA